MKTNQVSRTALVVAKSLVLTGHRPSTANLVEPEALDFAKQALRFAGEESFCRWAESPSFRWMAGRLEAHTIPGLCLHHALRKRAIEARVRQCLTSGARQVVIFGAGLDSLGYRLARLYPRVRFVEFDRPAMHAVKSRFLATVCPRNLELTPLDLNRLGTHPWPGLRPDQSTVAVLEGVLMYLPAVRAASLLHRLGEWSEQELRLIFTWMEVHGGRPAFAGQTSWADRWLRSHGEPFRWGLFRSDLPMLLDSLGLTLESISTTTDFASLEWPQLVMSHEIANGELMGEASCGIPRKTFPAARELQPQAIRPRSALQSARVGTGDAGS